MLGKTYRFVAKNATGVALGAGDSITLNCTRWNFDSNGARNAEESEASLMSGGGSLANNGYLVGSTQDNTAPGTKWFGGEFEFEATISTATPNGNIELYYQTSTDGGTTWPDNGNGELIAILNFTATGTKRDSFQL
jgi:hypothetical protein